MLTPPSSTGERHSGRLSTGNESTVSVGASDDVDVMRTTRGVMHPLAGHGDADRTSWTGNCANALPREPSPPPPSLSSVSSLLSTSSLMTQPAGRRMQRALSGDMKLQFY